MPSDRDADPDGSNGVFTGTPVVPDLVTDSPPPGRSGVTWADVSGVEAPSERDPEGPEEPEEVSEPDAVPEGGLVCDGDVSEPGTTGVDMEETPSLFPGRDELSREELEAG